MFLVNKGKGIVLRTVLILFIVSLIVVFLRTNAISEFYKMGNMGVILQNLRTLEGILIFILIYTIRPIFILLPASPMAFAAGAIYGSLFGTVIVIIGALTSGSFGFFIARVIGKGYFDKIAHKRISRLKEKMEHGSWATIISLNFVGLPWDLVSISAGLSKIRYRDFLLGIFISSVPQSLIAVLLGDVVFSIRSLGDVFQLKTIVVLVMVILGVILPHIIKRKMESIK